MHQIPPLQWSSKWVTSMGIVFMTGAIAFGQEGSPAYEKLKPIESFIGTWTTQFDPPGKVPVGKLEITFRWKCNKSYIESDVRFLPDGANRVKVLNPEFVVIGYSNSDKTTKAWNFKYELQGRTDAVIENDKLVIVQKEGEPGETNYRMQSKTYKLENSTTMVISDVSESAGEPSTTGAIVRLEKSDALEADK